jgi:phospholipid/cholesterol/gamma-HCH transport system substrate-binding protein
MRRSGRVPWGEVRVGIVILFAFAVLLWAAFNGTGMTFFEKMSGLEAYFDDIGGLATGSPVWLGGIEVGHISKIEFVEKDGVGKIRVAFKIRDNAWRLVSDSSTAAVAAMGLMGDKYLSVSLREPGQPPATPGNTLGTRPATDLTSAFAGAPEMMDNLSNTLAHFNTILGRIERGEGYLGRLTSEGRSSDAIDSVVTASRQLLVDLSKAQERLVAAMEGTARSFDSVSQGVLHGGGTLSRLVWDSALYVEFTNMARRANALVDRWDRGEGTLGKLSADSSMYVEIRDLAKDTRALLNDIRANPKKYFKVSVF